MNSTLLKYLDEAGAKFSAAIVRLSEVEWGSVGRVKKASNAILFREYLRRAALFLNRHNVTLNVPLFDPSMVVCGDVELPVGLIPEIFDTWQENMNTYTVFVCESFLKWCVLIDRGSQCVKGYEDLLDPLIRIFERGGDFGFRHGEAVVDRFTIPLNEWQKLATIEPIDTGEAALDEAEKRRCP